MSIPVCLYLACIESVRWAKPSRASQNLIHSPAGLHIISWPSVCPAGHSLLLLAWGPPLAASTFPSLQAGIRARAVRQLVEQERTLYMIPRLAQVFTSA